jgi:hypothetical protein
VAVGSSFLFLASCAAQTPSATPSPEPNPTIFVQPTPTSAPIVAATQARVDTQPVARVPMYHPNDFLSNYLSNATYPILVEGKPWINSSLNVAQYRDELGGTTFWDFWGDAEQWNTTNHQWQDDAGAWHLYSTEKIRMRDGRTTDAYILADRSGPGVMDALYFVHDTVLWRGDVLQHLKILGTVGIEDIAVWGNLQKLGNLRIVLDDQVAYDGAIRDWFSGKAQNLPPDLQKLFVWHYQDFGSDGNIVPLAYAKRLQVYLYDGDKPKWFMVTGVTLPAGTRISNAFSKEDASRLARNVLEPEHYLDQFANVQKSDLRIQSGATAKITLDGAGTVDAVAFSIPKSVDLKKLGLGIRSGGQVTADLPFLAFFSEPDVLSLHRSSPIGAIESVDSYLFYSNYPMPFQEGIVIELTNSSSAPLPITARWSRSAALGNTQFRAVYQPPQKLAAMSPDYAAKITGDGKLVGIVLQTKDQDFKNAQHRFLPNGTEDPATHIWGMGYLEANLTLRDGAGSSRIYNGHEDWALSGYFFNLGFTTPPGGANRPFGGILRYKDGEDGYATIFRYFNDLAAFRFKNGLALAFGHGSWKNNFPVTFGSTILYYQQTGGAPSELPASEYATPQ